MENPVLQPVIDLWRQLAPIPGTDKIPTVVTVRPAQTSAARGAMLRLTIDVSAPGIADFIPGGTVRVTNDLTHKPLKSVQIALNTGTATVDVRVPKRKASHINLHASYLDRFTVHGKASTTKLWMPSVSTNVPVTVK